MYADMERVSKIWEIELQAVLEINKLGHRKRILYSVAERNKLLPPNLEEINGVDSVRGKFLPDISVIYDLNFFYGHFYHEILVE